MSQLVGWNLRDLLAWTLAWSCPPYAQIVTRVVHEVFNSVSKSVSVNFPLAKLTPDVVNGISVGVVAKYKGILIQ